MKTAKPIRGRDSFCPDDPVREDAAVVVTGPNASGALFRLAGQNVVSAQTAPAVTCGDRAGTFGSLCRNRIEIAAFASFTSIARST